MSRKGSVPSGKQMIAIIRNHKVLRLRGIAAVARSLHEIPQADLNRILMGVDGGLRALGALSEKEHRAKQLAKEGIEE